MLQPLLCHHQVYRFCLGAELVFFIWIHIFNMTK
jgi:hypothetical protein